MAAPSVGGHHSRGIDDGYEVPIELRNFEYLIVGEGWNGWALYFERGTDRPPVLVGVSVAKALVGV